MSGTPAARYIIPARALTTVLGCAALVWGFSVLPSVWRQAPLERIAGRIIAGEPFRLDTLAGLTPVAEAAETSGYCRPAGVRSVAIVRLRLAEQALASGDRQLADRQMMSAGDSIRNALSCSPADPFLWLVLYWMETTRNGFRPAYLDLLRMSYRLGPNEGWIAIRRNRLAFEVYEQLPKDIAEQVLNEFVAMLATGLHQEAVDIFTGPAWRMREAVLARLQNVGEPRRREFARLLEQKGYRVTVPGVEPAEPRPWR